MDVMTLAAKLTLNTSEFDSGLKGSEKEMQGLTSGGVAWGNLMSRVVEKAGKALFNFGKQTVQVGMDFDTQMSQVKALGQMQEDEFIKVRQKAIDLGASTKFTAAQVAEAFSYMALAGWDTDEMLDGIEGMLSLAAASGEDLGRTSDIVTDALTAFGLEAKDSGHFVDVLAAASANSNTTVSQMGEAFKYLATTGGVLNYSIDDVAVALGLLANNGIKSGQAGTSLRRIITSLISPTDKAADAMSALGVNLFEEGTDKVKPFKQVLTELRTIFKESDFNLEGIDMEKVQPQLDELDAWYDEMSQKIEAGGGKIKDSIDGSVLQQADIDAEYADRIKKITGANELFLGRLSDIGGVRGISSLIALMKTTDKDFDQLVNAVDNSDGAAQQMAETMLDNLEGDITILKSALEGLQIVVSDDFKSKLRSFVQTLTGEIGNLNEAFQSGSVLGMFTNLADWVINGITGALMDAQVTGEDASRFGEAIGDFVGRTVAHLVTNAPEIIKGLFNAGINLAGGLIEGLFAGLFGTGEGTVPGLILSAEQMEENALKQATASSTQAKGILEYMDSLKEQYGDAAENTEEWAKALEKLKEVYPAINEYIATEGGNLSATNQSLLEYIENNNKRIEQEAKKKALQKYIDAYTEAQASETEAKIEREMALSQANEAQSSLIAFVASHAGNENFTGKGLSFDQIVYAARAVATEFGESQTEIDALTKVYNDNTKIVQDSEAKIRELEESTIMLKSEMDNASNALAKLASAAGSSGYTPYGEWANNYYSNRYGHAKGLWSVPYDDYAANLHRGEMVLTASQARDYRESKSNGNVDLTGLEDRIERAIRNGMANAKVNSYLNGQDITDDVSRNTVRELKARRFST